MQIHVYAGEHFVRTRGRYIIAGVVFSIIVLLALLGGNVLQGIENITFSWQGLFGAFLLIGMAWAYRKRAYRLGQELVVMQLHETGISVADKELNWGNIEGFGLEINRNTQELYNLVLVTNRGIQVHTFADEQEHLQEFIQELANHIPFLENIQFSRSEKLLRRLKL